MNRLYYAGVISKEPPKEIQIFLSLLSFKLKEEGMILRAINYKDLDNPFIRGVSEPENMEIFMIKEIFNIYSECFEPTPYLNGKKIYFTEEGRNSAYIYNLPLKFKSNIDLLRIMRNEIRQEDIPDLILSYYQVMGYSEIKDKVYHFEPVSMVICWTEDECISHSTRTEETGIAGQVISIADMSYINIPIYNLSIKEHRDILNNYLLGSVSLKSLLNYKNNRQIKIEEHLSMIKKLTKSSDKNRKKVSNDLNNLLMDFYIEPEIPF